MLTHRLGYSGYAFQYFVVIHYYYQFKYRLMLCKEILDLFKRCSHDMNIHDLYHKRF